MLAEPLVLTRENVLKVRAMSTPWWFVLSAVAAVVAGVAALPALLHGRRYLGAFYVAVALYNAFVAGHAYALYRWLDDGRAPIVTRMGDGSYMVDRLDPGESIELPVEVPPAERGAL